MKAASRRGRNASFSFGGWALLLLALGFTVAATPVSALSTQAAPLASVGTGGTDTKPQNKCFYAQGTWWCALLDGADTFLWKYDGAYTWTKQAVPGGFDAANAGRADCLSVGNTVFVAIVSSTVRIYKFNYDGTNYVADPAWSTPVTVPGISGASSAVLAQDSNGKLWLTADTATQILVSYPTTDERTWVATPFVLDTTATDTSSIVAFGGDKIGVFWSNHVPDVSGNTNFKFQVHLDSEVDPTIWQPVEIVDSATNLVDNHVHLDAAPDGRIFAAVKTSLTLASDPEIALYVRSAGGTWAPRIPIVPVPDTVNATRPIVSLSPSDNLVYVFFTRLNNGSLGGTIEYRSADMTTLSFGPPTTFIAYAGSRFNDASSSKDGFTLASGVMVIAKDVITSTVYFDTLADGDNDGWSLPGDCNDNDSLVNPGATEITYNGKDDDCNPATKDDDLDNDGYPFATDCDDNDPNVNPGMTEVPYNGKDDDCNPATKDDDLDGDTYPIATDCDDTNPNVNPGMTEIPWNGINDDCSLPSFLISDATITEGDAGVKNLVFTVGLDSPAQSPHSVDYHTVDGSATAGSDYVAQSGTLTFGVGVLNRTVSVPIKGDLTPEPDETFTVALTGNSSGTILEPNRNVGTGTIVDDDTSAFDFSAAIYPVSESLGFATIAVKRTGGVKTLTTVGYATSDGTATSAANQDYTATVGTLTFKPGVTMQTFRVPITRDDVDETDETVLLSLRNPSAPSRLGTQRTAVLTIRDNDVGGHVQLTAAAYKVTEPAPGGAPVKVKVAVSRIGGMAGSVTVHYDVSGGTATPNADYTPTSGTLTFDTVGAGAVMRSFTIDVLPDPGPGLAEGVETVNVTLSAPGGGATLGTPNAAVLSILDAQPSFEFSAPTYSVKETSPFTLITVKRWGRPLGTAMVDYATSDGTATAGQDYQAASGTLTFRQGITSQSIKVPILKDTLVEGSETVNLALTQAAGQPPPGALANAVLTIVDVSPTVSFASASYAAAEPSGSTPRPVTITVKRTGSLLGTATADYLVTGGTATDVSDYQLLNAGTLTFGPNVGLRTFLVEIEPDSAVEGDETVELSLAGITGAAPGNPATTVLTIHDSAPTLEFVTTKYTASEKAAKATLAVRRVGSTLDTATVKYSVTGGTATQGADFTLAAGTLTFAPHVALRTIPVTLIPDTVDEPNETVEVSLTNSTNAGVGANDKTVLTIIDDDTAGTVQFGAAQYSVSEAEGSAVVTVRRIRGTSSQATVDYVIAGGTAGSLDYTLVPGTLTFAAGETTKTLLVPVNNDGLVEAPESLILRLQNPGGNLSIGAIDTTTLWILDPQ